MKKIIAYFSNVKDLLRDILKELSKISYYLYCLNQRVTEIYVKED